MADIQDYNPILTGEYNADENNNQLLIILQQIRDEIDRLNAVIKEIKGV